MRDLFAVVTVWDIARLAAVATWFSYLLLL